VSASGVQIGGRNWLVNKQEPIQPPSQAEIVVNERFANYRLNWLKAERNFYLQPVGILTLDLMKAHSMMHSALKLSYCRKGNFAVIFALILPVFASIIAFIGDQANMAHMQTRVSQARDAALVAVAQEHIHGNKSHAQLEAYAKDFFLANLGEEYANATSVKLTVPRSMSAGGFTLEAHVRHEPFFAPVYAAASGRPGSEFTVDIH
jgi:Flp pilus assembly protein TadG